MTKVLYIDCISGVAGDMLLGALLDSGVPREVVDEALDSLALEHVSIAVTETQKGALRCTRVHVKTSDDAPARRVVDILAMLERSQLTPAVAARALDAFRILGTAEARVHGTSLEDTHLHEAGALDAIVDVVGVCAAVAHVGADRIVCSPLLTGRGETDGAHGKLPIPAPAVLEIVSARSIPMAERGTEELVTPTGSALVAVLADDFGPMPPMTISSIGYGGGARDHEMPNVVRVVSGQAAQMRSAIGDIVVVECNLDDMTPELVPHVVDTLMAAGAQDAWITPIVMKKGRPATMLSALTSARELSRVVDVFYRETTTFGLRITNVTKDELAREWIEVTAFGERLRVKIGRRNGDIVTMAPEYEDARAVARATGHPLKSVMAEAMRAAAERVETYR